MRLDLSFGQCQGTPHPMRVIEQPPTDIAECAIVCRKGVGKQTTIRISERAA